MQENKHIIVYQLVVSAMKKKCSMVSGMTGSSYFI